MEYTDSATAAQEQPSLPPVPMPLPFQLPIATKIDDAPTSPNKHSAASLLVGLSSDEQPTTVSQQQQTNNPLYSSNQKPTVAKGPSTMSKNNNEDDVIVNAIVGANVKKSGVKNGRKKYYCKEEGCNNLVQLAGLCIKHGASRKKCSHEGCNNLAKVKGVCIKHGAKIVGKRCIYEGCNNWARKKGLCVKHGADRSNSTSGTNRDTCTLAEETAALAAAIPPEAEVVAVPLLPPVLAEPNPMEPNPEENITHQI